MQKTLFEWVLVMSKGEDVYLTENQYEAYKESWKDGKIFFRNIEVNPAFVVQAYKRPAEEIYKIYPCERCHATKQIFDYENKANIICPSCEGTGLSI